MSQPGNTPVRRSIAAAALVCEQREGRSLWLGQWSRTWHRFHFVGGHKNDRESFRECLAREISEELDLKEHQDYDMAAEPTAHLEFTAWSEGAMEETAYTTELFEVRLHDGAARDKVDADPVNRWLTEAEILAGQCTDGKPISATMKLLLSKINWGRSG
jgi:8-oxo-dGTP pyrophosphatase MutT (NUDIX family)